MERFIWICVAGALGTGCRYLIGLWSAQRFGTTFPYGTLIVNVVGCFLIALVMRIALEVATFPVNLRLALTTGFMGGLTTYSSFNFETTKLLLEGKRAIAIANIGATLVLCFVAGMLGLLVASRVTLRH
jgi:fluoride exporter